VTPASRRAPVKTERGVLDALARLADPRVRDAMEPRYGIRAVKAWGIPMAKLLAVAKELGRDRALAAALWKSGWYEARIVAALIEDPGALTPAQMERWCQAFDNWGICDTVCFKLFDRSPHALAMAAKWCGREEEFVKRAGFALLASFALHDEAAPDSAFAPFFPRMERGAADERNFVKKGVSWALRAVATRSQGLRKESIALAKRLAESAEPAPRWVGKDVLRQIKN
jgi:3-methyladenine DNA glycosylase AlkD